MKKTLILIFSLLISVGIYSQTDLEITKSVNNATPNVGTNVTFTITAKNNGSSLATGVNVQDILPNGYTFVSANPSVGTWTAPNWSVGNLANGISETLTIIATVKPILALPLLYNNTAIISGNEVDLTPANNSDTENVTPVPVADLSITSTINSLTPAIGSLVTLVISATNNGLNNANGVNVSNILPNGYTLVSATPSNGTYTAPNWIIGNLLIGQTAVLTIQAVVKATGIYNLSSVITGTLLDPVSSNNTAAISVTPNVRADLVLTNTNYQTVYVAGSTVNYTVTVTNFGPSIASNVAVTNNIPSGVVQFSWTGSNGSGGLNENLVNVLPTLAVGASVSYTITLDIPTTFIGNFINTASISSTSVDPNPACTQCIDTDIRALGADIEVINTNNQTIYTPGTTVVYTITVMNNGPQTALNVAVSNAIPAGITQFSWTGSNGSSGTNTALINTIPTMALGIKVIYTITLQIPIGFIGNLVSQTVISSPTADPKPGCTYCIDTDTPTPNADVVVVNTDNKTNYIPGQTNTYTITVTNNGPNNALNVNVQNLIPAGITSFSWVGSNLTSGNTALNNTIPILFNGQIVTYTISMLVPITYSGNLVSNTAVTSSTVDPNPACALCSDTDVVAVGADIVVTNTDNISNYVLGETNTYIVIIKNNGPQVATNVNVFETIPSGITQFSWTGSNGTSGTNANLNDTILALAVGTSVIYTITIQVPLLFVGNLNSVVSISSSTIDPNPACPNCSDIDLPTPTTGADLVVTKTDNSLTFTPGTSNNYVITVKNKGPNPAINVNVSDIVPAGIVATDVTWTGTNGSSGTGNLTNTIPSLAVGQTIVYLINMPIPSSFNPSSSLTNQVVVTSQTADPEPGCTTCIDVDTPKPIADIVTVKTDNKTTFINGSDNNYTIIVTNNGPSDSQNIVVSDPLPAGITTMTWTGSNGSNGIGSLVNTIPNLAVGQSVIYTVRIKIPLVFTTAITNIVSVVSQTNDPVLACLLCSDNDAPAPKTISITAPKFNPTQFPPFYTVDKLVIDILINSSCATISNITSSATPVNSGIGYFQRNNSEFPFKDGIIIKTGTATTSAGLFTDSSNTTGGTGATDIQLKAISDSNPVTPNDPISDVSFIKFDFTPKTNKFSFNFIFASNEYGQYQCTFGDVFAFVLTDVTSGTPFQNLAVVPSTSTPVSVTTVRKEIYNSPGSPATCDDQNPTFFDTYNVGSAATSLMNMRGYTKSMKAEATVVPGHNYTIKLVIGDFTDTAFDSAVFIEGGSFDVGQSSIQSNTGLTEFTIANGGAPCVGDTRVLQSGAFLIPGATYFWTRDNLVIPGAVSNSITVSQPGEYSSTVLIGGATGCEQTDKFLVEYLPELQIQTVIPTFRTCPNTNFDLTQNDITVLNGLAPTDYIVSYHLNQADADNNIAVDAANFIGNNGGQPIFVRVEDAIYGCIKTTSFLLDYYPNIVSNIAGTATIQTGTSTTVNFTGTPNAIVTFKINNGAEQQITLDNTGNFIFPTGFLNSTTTYTLVNVTNLAGICIIPLTNSITITTQNFLSASNNGPICENDTFNLTTTNAGVGATYAWTGPNGFTSFLQNPINVPAPTTPPFDYIVTPTLAGNSLPNSSTTLFVNPLPTGTITASSPSACLGNLPAPTITFEGLGGTAPYIFNYTLNANPQPQETTIIGNTIAIDVPINTVGPQVYVLTSVEDANCLNVLTTLVTATVNILNAPIINTPVLYEVCDDDLNPNGIAQFDLPSLNPQITSNATLQITYHLTQEDADLGAEALVNPYPNITPFNQTVYVRVFDPFAPACFSTRPVQLQVNPRPKINLLLKPFAQCDVAAPFGTEVFILNSQDVNIINGQAGVFTVKYYEFKADADANNANTLPNSFVSAGQTIWYNISFNGTGCNSVGSLKLELNALPMITPLAYAPYQLCDDDQTNLGIEKFDLASKKLGILLGQSGVDVTFYASPTDAVSNTAPITNLMYFNTTPFAQTLGIRLTNTKGCYALSTMDLIVNPLPTPQVPPAVLLSVCDSNGNGFGSFNLNDYTQLINQNPNPLQPTIISYYRTESDAKISALPINLSIPFNNVNAYSQDIWVRSQNSVTGCFRVIKITLNVNPSPIVPLLTSALLPDLVKCDSDSNNQDGTTTFDLTPQTAALLLLQPTAAPNYVITYFTTQAAAISATGLPIVQANNYIGSNNQEIWVRIENINSGCFQVTSFKLKVNSPLLLPAPFVLALCDDGSTTAIPTRTFDLVKFANPILLGTANPDNYTIAYYSSQANANAGTSPLVNYTNTVNPQTIFAVVTTNNVPAGSGGCRSFVTLDLEVRPLPNPGMMPTPLAPKCDDNSPGDLKEIFDLTINQIYIRNGQNVTLRYFETLALAEAGLVGTEILNPTAALVGGDVFVRVENNLSSNSFGEKCFVIVRQPLKVNPLPSVSILNPASFPGNLYQICESQAGSTPSEFNFTSLIPELLAGNLLLTPPTALTNFTTTFHTSLADATAGTGAIATPGAYISPAAVGTESDIFIRVVNNLTGCVSFSGTFKIVVNKKPIVNLPDLTKLNTCDTDGNNDGMFSYPLDNPALISEILGLTQATGFTLTFHATEAEAKSGAGAITNLAGYMGQTQSLWIRVQNDLTKCFEIGESKQVVEKIPVPKIETDNNINTICIDYITKYPLRTLVLNAVNEVTASTPTIAYSYQWFIKNATGTFVPIAIGGNNSSYEVNTSEPDGATRFYKVELTNTTALGCAVTSAEFGVIQSGPAINQIGTNGYFVTNAFESNQIITATVTGYGTYQYSLDGGERQDSPVFENVSLGSHLITVYDTEGGALYSCDLFEIKDVQTIDYPHYFTPNGDGFNDSWNIVGLSNQLDSKIYIFDREGKLIKQIAPNGDGWDGTFNGNLVPSTDYWFTVDFTEKTLQKQFKSHFSLKR